MAVQTAPWASLARVTSPELSSLWTLRRNKGGTDYETLSRNSASLVVSTTLLQADETSTTPAPCNCFVNFTAGKATPLPAHEHTADMPDMRVAVLDLSI